jgi:hypothetical protein
VTAALRIHQQRKSSQSGRKELLMGSTIRDLGNTIKEAQSFLSKGGAAEASDADEEEDDHAEYEQ